MAKPSFFGAATRTSQSDVNKRAHEISEKLGDVPKPEPKHRQNRMMTRRPAASADKAE